MTLSQRQELEFGGRSVKLRTQLAYVPPTSNGVITFFKAWTIVGLMFRSSHQQSNQCLNMRNDIKHLIAIPPLSLVANVF